MYAFGGEKVQRLKNRSGGYKDTLLPLLKPLRESRYRRWGIIICSSYTKKVNNLNPAMKIAHCCSQARMRRNPKTIEMFEVASSKGSKLISLTNINAGDVSIDHIGKEWYKVEFFYEEDIRWSSKFSPFHATVDSIVSWREAVHDCPLKIPNRNFIQVERLENEPAVFPTDMVNDEALQQQLSKEVILVFPQSTIHEEENDPGWTVVANRKRKAKMSLRDGRSFKEAAKGVKFRDGDISYVGHGGGKMLDVG
ncbi:hypothetical protein Pyn_03221 [Prunus yedoensis var. nudiflora]|uniref:Uncharacterized protein n=1 Tax=Prunus yedoensis var. nudiflora TaxID=2094558 RepID=A0A314ZMU9_PRUYE|nr:hypothetical protein Pyn_03221 [Prunus yedoensis var. nudiflora]